MLIKRLKTLALSAAFAIPTLGAAQAVPASTAVATPNLRSEVGGRTSIDLVRLRASTPSVPLRHGALIPGSETLDLDGRTLQRGRDYAADYAQGTIYLMVPVRDGQGLRAQYRYDPDPKPQTGAPVFGGFTFNALPGVSMLMGLGMTERAADGTVLSSNVYGLRNNFGFGGAGLRGMYVVGERSQVQASSLLEPEQQAGPQAEGRARAMLENLDTSALGGKFSASLQDIDSNFAGWNAFRGGGYDNAYVDQLMKEKGLKRLSLGFQNVGAGAMRLSQSFRNVRDGDNSVEWRSLGVKLGGVEVNWSGQRVDQGFTRFADLAEGDRDQLAKEAGLLRETLGGKLNLGFVSAGYNALKVEDSATGAGVYRRSLDFNLKYLKGSYFDQSVERDFSRFGSLREADAGQLAREGGIRRQSYGFELLPRADGLSGLSFSSNALRTDSGDLKTTEFNARLGSFNLYRGGLDADAGTSALGVLSEPEIQSDLKTIVRLYVPGEVGLQPQERNWLMMSGGLDRQATRLSGRLFKGLDLTAQQIDLRGQNDTGSVRSISLASPRASLTYRVQDFGAQLTEVATLLDFEKALVGTNAGIRKQNLDFGFKFDANKSFTVSSMKAETEQGAAARQSLSYADKGFELSYSSRNVDQAFASLPGLVDPERDLLMGLVGMSQRDFSLKWTPYRGMRFETRRFDSEGDAEHDQLYRNTYFSYDMDRNTQLIYRRLTERYVAGAAQDTASDVEGMSVYRRLGKFGALLLADERRTYGGITNPQPDARRKSLVYEASLNSKTALKAEQTRTEYEDGGSEAVSANTISTELNSRTGVSLNETRIDRDGDKPDETKRNYGFWFDFGRGIRFNYGYARSLRDEAMGEMQSSASLSPGSFQGIKIDQANYTTQRWDQQRNRSQGDVVIGTEKPIRLGLFSDATFGFGTNTLRDNGGWAYENQRAGFAGKVAGVGIGYNYLSQISPTGERAIDRAFSFSSDPTGKSKVRANLTYKVRTLPGNEQVMIRDYSLTVRPFKGWELTNQMQTNPEVPNGGVILGTQPQAYRSNSWKLDLASNGDVRGGLNWNELINEQNRTLARTGGVNLMLFANNPSPVYLYYGIEQSDANGIRQTAHRYSLRYDQRPGPNQLLSLFLGNLSWQHSRPADQKLQNWALRFEYQLKF